MIGQGQPQPPQITPDLIKKGEFRKCDNCEGLVFESAHAICKISKILTASPEDHDVPVRVVMCKACGLVPEWSDPEGVLPEELKKIKE